MDQGEALLQEALQAPDDDAPRLVYADWLAEHGDEDGRARAELIHAQCELERCTPEQRPALRVLIRKLMKRHQPRWTRALREAKLGGTRWKFRRGFLDGVRLSAAKFVTAAPKLFELAPTLRSFVFPEASNELVRLAGHPLLARVVEADLHEMCVCGFCRIQDELPVFFASPHVANLRVLDLADDRIDGANAAVLAGSAQLERLTRLELRANPIGDDGAIALANGKLAALSSLGVAFTGITDAGVAALAGMRLARLDLRGNTIGAEGARALELSPALEAIEVLDLRSTKLPRASGRALRARFGSRLK